MPRRIIIETFELQELSSDARTRAIELVRQRINEGFDGAQITEMFRQALSSEYGIETAGCNPLDIEWRLSNCQGDGMAFYGNIRYETMLHRDRCAKIAPQLKQLLEVFQQELSVRINRNEFGQHYSHWNTMTVEVELYGRPQCDEYQSAYLETTLNPGPNTDPEAEAFKKAMAANDMHIIETKVESLRKAFERWLSDYVKTASRELELKGYAEIDNDTGEEAAIAYAESMDLLFDSKGHIVAYR